MRSQYSSNVVIMTGFSQRMRIENVWSSEHKSPPTEGRNALCIRLLDTTNDPRFAAVGAVLR